MIKAQEKREGKKARSKSQHCCVTFKSKLLQILLIAHAWGSEADILHLEQMTTKTMTCKSFGRFYFFFIASQRPENSSTVAFIHILWQNSQKQWVKEDSWVLSQEILSLDWTLGTQIGWTNEILFATYIVFTFSLWNMTHYDPSILQKNEPSNGFQGFE